MKNEIRPTNVAFLTTVHVQSFFVISNQFDQIKKWFGKQHFCTELITVQLPLRNYPSSRCLHRDNRPLDLTSTTQLVLFGKTRFVTGLRKITAEDLVLNTNDEFKS